MATEALQSNQYKNFGIRPSWQIPSTGSVKTNAEIISSLPTPPPCKQFYYRGQEYRPNNKPTTPEGNAVTNLLLGNAPTSEDLKIIQEAIGFYKICLPILEKIDLTAISDEQAETLKGYLRCILSTQVYLTNNLTVNCVYRATLYREEFLENDKVRDTKFLTHPTEEILKRLGRYNRASSPDRPILYTAESLNTAVREINPQKGDRIIVSTWLNHSGKPLKAYPLVLAAGIQNKQVDSATMAFEQFHKDQHPLVGVWMEQLFAFMTNAFIKQCEFSHPKKYEYLYSAYVGDCILQPKLKDSPTLDFDCILYPSVAGMHVTNNLAITPQTVKSSFRIIDSIEYDVLETWYGKDFYNDEAPALLHIKRKSKSIFGDRIIWDDD